MKNESARLLSSSRKASITTLGGGGGGKSPRAATFRAGPARAAQKVCAWTRSSSRARRLQISITRVGLLSFSTAAKRIKTRDR